MTVKTLKITLEVPVEPLDNDRIEYLVEDDPELTREDLPLDPDDYTPHELAEVVQGLFYDEAVSEAFAGSEMYVTFGSPVIASAEWAA